MPENGFETIRRWMTIAARKLQLSLSAREVYRVTSVYISTLRGDEYSTLTYADTTGEEACRRWLADQFKAVAA